MIRQWWSRREAGERRALLAGMAFLIAVSWYLLLAEPLAQALERAHGRYQAADSLVHEMARIHAQVRQLRRQSSSDPVGEDEMTLLTRLLGEAGLVLVGHTVEPGVDGTLDIRIEPCPFERLLPFLVSLRRHRIALVELAYDPDQEVELVFRLR